MNEQNNMDDLFSKVNDMLKSDNMPGELKDLVKNLSNSNSSNNSENETSNTTSNSSIDMDTLLKLKSVMDKGSNEDDPRANLLYSLKPYLSSKKRGKVDQYVKFFNMSKMMTAFNMFGGEKDK